MANGDLQYSVGEERRRARAAAQAAKAARAGRDAGGFVPWLKPVQVSPGYRLLSYPARALLMDMVHSGVNGKLSASSKYLHPLGWTSAGTVAKCLKELIDCGLLHMTRRGSRSNVAACFAVTWNKLEDTSGLDPELVASFKRGAYLTPAKPAAAIKTKKTKAATEARRLNAKVRAQGYMPLIDSYKPAPSDGAVTPQTCSVRRSTERFTAPSNGAVRAEIALQPAPLDGAYLEITISEQSEVSL